MPNSLIDAYRQKMADAGTPDDRDEYFIMTEDLIPLAQQNPDLLQQYPDFAKEYGQYREAAAPSLAGEFGKTLKGGTEETLSTYAGLGALASGSDTLKETARDLESAGAENAPTIPTLEDIAPGETGLAKVFSKDTARYLTGKAGSFIPSILEMAGLGVAGGVVGSAVEPGVGTAAGIAEGGVEAALGRGIIKDAIKSLLKEGVADKMAEKGLITEASEQGIKDAILGGDEKAAELVTKQAKSLAAGRSEAAVNFANVYGMSAGGIYNETDNREASLGLGAAAAALAAPPFISLPARIVKGMFPKLSADAAQEAAQDLIGKKAAELVSKLSRGGVAVGVGTGGMIGMEAANIVAKNLTDGKDALDLSDDDWKRLREAAVGGALASAPFGVLAARGTSEAPLIAEPAVKPAPAEPAAATTAVEPDAIQQAAATPSPLDIYRSIKALSPEQQRARLEELNNNAARTATEETEFVQLRSLVPRAAPAPTPEPAAEQPPVASADIALHPDEVSPGVPSLDAAGFDSQRAFAEAYASTHDSEVGETEDEFKRRIYCQGQAA